MFHTLAALLRILRFVFWVIPLFQGKQRAFNYSSVHCRYWTIMLWSMPPLKFCVYNGFYRIWVSPVSSLRLFIITIRVLLRFLNIRFSMGAHNISLIDCHFVCHHLQLGTTDLPFVSSLLHLADFFTKTHIAACFCFILSKLLVLSTLTPRVCELAS